MGIPKSRLRLSLYHEAIDNEICITEGVFEVIRVRTGAIRESGCWL
jgi:hypothetical protein